MVWAKLNSTLALPCSAFFTQSSYKVAKSLPEDGDMRPEAHARLVLFTVNDSAPSTESFYPCFGKHRRACRGVRVCGQAGLSVWGTQSKAPWTWHVRRICEKPGKSLPTPGHDVPPQGQREREAHPLTATRAPSPDRQPKETRGLSAPSTPAVLSRKPQLPTKSSATNRLGIIPVCILPT